ncbi:MAG: single-stranded-DNA-specific exonuclease RecJ [Candidatus Bathyarchaeia archaeon]
MVLINRGVSLQEVPDFINPRLRKLSDPFLLDNLEKAVERTWKAISNRERILIFGDFDTDGITAAVILNWVLSENGGKVDIFFPLRMEDGYGLSVAALQRLKEKYDLVFTVDCGITNLEGANYLRGQGTDLIILDHHDPSTELPNAFAIINPKLQNHSEHLKYLAGVGVVFKFCHGFLQYGRKKKLGGWRPDLREGLDLVALGTIADIVPLLGDNRIMARYGMKILQSRYRPGVHALCEICGIKNRLTSEDIAFRLAPRINAAGRMGDARQALILLQSQSIVEAHSLASSLDALNQQRQVQEELVYQSARMYVEERELYRKGVIVIWDDTWHPGVLGIVAARLVQEYHRPVIVLSKNSEGEYCGSGRSIPGCNLIELLEPSRPFLLRFGGHPMAVGVAITEENLELFEQSINETIIQSFQEIPPALPVLEIDGVVELKEITENWFRERELLQPFGHKNPQPCFLFQGVLCTRIAFAGQGSTRGILSDHQNNTFDFICFGTKPDAFPPSPWDVVAVPEISSYFGYDKIQLRILDFRPTLQVEGRMAR